MDNQALFKQLKDALQMFSNTVHPDGDYSFIVQIEGPQKAFRFHFQSGQNGTFPAANRLQAVVQAILESNGYHITEIRQVEYES